MPNRIIKESICTSDNLDTLSAFEEVMFYRLLVNCDDYGRMDARPKILASKLFPLKDIRVNQIESGLRALTSAELVILYQVDGKPFLQMKTWECHQQVRAKKSKYPGPDNKNSAIDNGNLAIDNENKAFDNACNQLIADDSKCSRNPIQSESESESNPKPDGARLDEDFATFWAAYPRKTDKQDAMKAFRKLKPDAALMAVLLAAIEKQKNSPQWTKDGGQFIPHAATWLNGRRWEDQMPMGGKRVSAQAYGQREYQPGELEALDDDLMDEARKYRANEAAVC